MFGGRGCDGEYVCVERVVCMCGVVCACGECSICVCICLSVFLRTCMFKAYAFAVVLCVFIYVLLHCVNVLECEFWVHVRVRFCDA